MAHATRRERQEAKELGASIPLYRGARRAGATHGEALSVLGQERSFWRYELFRTAGASHAKALALESEGVDAIAYRDLRRIGVADEEVIDANRRGVALDVYFSARKAALGHDDAVALVCAGLGYAASKRTWETAARARQLLASRHQETQGNLTQVVQGLQGFKGDPDHLVRRVAAGDVARSEQAA
jgi:hypothetical protein